MAEKRFVPCNLFSSDFFMDLTHQERLIWLGLVINIADDQGRLQDNARIIKSHIFPADNINDWEIEKTLVRLGELQQIFRYSDTNGKRLIQIVDWWKDYQDSRFINVSKYQPPENWIDKENINCSEQKAIQLKNEISDREIVEPKSQPGNYTIKRNLDKSGGFTKFPEGLAIPMGLGADESCTPPCTPPCTHPYDKDSNSTCTGDSEGENERNQDKEKEREKERENDPDPDPDSDHPDLIPASPGSSPSENPKAAKYSQGWFEMAVKRISGHEIELSTDQRTILINYYRTAGHVYSQTLLMDCFKELPNAEFVNLAIEKIQNNQAPMPFMGAHNEIKK